MTETNKNIILASDKEVIIFGYSNIGFSIYNDIRDFYEGEVLFCDNSSEKQGKHDNKVVLSVEKAAELYPDSLYLLSSIYHVEQMKKQLLTYGISKDNIIDCIDDVYIYQEKNRLAALTSRLRENDFEFEVSVTKRCNLNCKSCDHFAPLAKEGYKEMSIEIYKSDIIKMSSLFGDTVKRITLLGGEPLLRDDISDFIFIARAYFPKTILRLLTNGLLLQKMDCNFWTICRDSKTLISVTKYPINVDYEKIREVVLKNGCSFEFCGSSEATRTFWHEPLDLEGRQPVEKNFRSCTFGNRCIVLDKGKLFSCIIPANIELFNNFFGKNLEVTEEDYVSIYEETDRITVLRKLANPFSFCRYCDIKHRTFDHEFEKSTRRIEEWTI